jgi:hypothetical protein
MALNGILPILKKALVKLTLGLKPISMWVFVAEITEEIMLRLDILYTYDASVDLERHMLLLAQDKI